MVQKRDPTSFPGNCMYREEKLTFLVDRPQVMTLELYYHNVRKNLATTEV